MTGAYCFDSLGGLATDIKPSLTVVSTVLVTTSGYISSNLQPTLQSQVRAFSFLHTHYLWVSAPDERGLLRQLGPSRTVGQIERDFNLRVYIQVNGPPSEQSVAIDSYSVTGLVVV